MASPRPERRLAGQHRMGGKAPDQPPGETPGGATGTVALPGNADHAIARKVVRREFALRLEGRRAAESGKEGKPRSRITF